MKTKRSGSDYALDITIYLILGLVFIVMLYPFWNVFVISINDATDTIRGNLYLWPRVPTLQAYKAVLSDSSFTSSFFVTVLRTVIGTPISLLLTAMAAYAFTNRKLVGYKFLYRMFLFTMYFGGGMIPLYMTLKAYSLINTFWVYILPSAFSVYYMILIRASMSELPGEVLESARIDGANDLTIFWRIMLPLSKPVLATIGLFIAINHWNSFIDTQLYTSDPRLVTLQAMMMKILNQYQTKNMMDAARSGATVNQQNAVTPDSIRMAATIISTVPIILVYPFIQKYFVKGIMIGSIKA